MNDIIKVAVPAGIGDVSWIWSKLINIPGRFQIYTPDTYPQRTFQWLHLLGDRVIPAIGKHGYNEILTQEARLGYENYDSWERIKGLYSEGEVIYLQPNQWFLSGKSLSSWLPDIKTNFHYPLHIPAKDLVSGLGMLRGKKSLGIHMASIKGARNWNCWLPEDWVNFINIIHREYPDLQMVLLGGIWDLDMAMEVLGGLDSKIPVLDLIGKTNIGQAITILNNLTYYIGYSSGLNVMMNVLDKSCTALWPKHQREHMYCHADPKQVEERRYLGFVYDDPERIFTRIRSIIQGAIDGKIR